MAKVLEFPHHNVESIGDMSLVRETAAERVRDSWQVIKQKREELSLHFAINPYEEIVPVPGPAETIGIMRLLEIAGVWFCRNFHLGSTYTPGDYYLTCACGRKYALPWAFNEHPSIKRMFPVVHDPNVYVNDEPFPMPAERTRQAPIRMGTQGVF
jgi:hypothetical protein